MTRTELFDNLIAKIKTYHPSNDLSLVEKAYRIADEAHADQLRKSGEPYIIHPLYVAIILSEIEMDLETIVAGILHDIIEDTSYTFEDVSNLFSEEIALLVDGVTKLERIENDSIRNRHQDEVKGLEPLNQKQELQVETYRKMFLAMAKDIRVILIKIADRLHNMRTLFYTSPESQREKAQETLDIYAPLAHRLGISKLRYELEDLAFRYLNPESYQELAEKINSKQIERQAFVNNIVDVLKDKLEQANIQAKVEGRPKHYFSIYKKMVAQNKSLDQIYDIFAVRAIVNDVRDCYEVMGIAHENWKPIPGRVKDYIAMPKANMYQSLHTTLIGSEGEPFEVQIRTWEMHKVSEYGIAAHWKYKSKGMVVDQDSEEEKLAWLRQILEWQRDLQDNREYLDALKFDLNVFRDHVYCFTPKGEVISLVSGSTPIDFAYAIHSSVGNKMIGARVNNRIVTFDYELATGDRVEIITSQNSKGPSKDWLKLVRSSQARSKINQWFKKENKAENYIKGKELLEREAKKKGYALSDLLSEDRLKLILNRFSLIDWESLCSTVGHGGIKEGQVINRLLEEYLKTLPQDEVGIVVDESENIKNRNKKSGIVVKGIGDLSVRFSKCCSPVPGDEIIGFITRGRGVSIHRTDCNNIICLEELERHRLIEAEWMLPDNLPDRVVYRADIRIITDEKIGMLTDVSRIINDENISVKSLNVRTGNSQAVFNLGIEISSREQLDRICNRITHLSGVHEIQRVTL